MTSALSTLWLPESWLCTCPNTNFGNVKKTTFPTQIHGRIVYFATSWIVDKYCRRQCLCWLQWNFYPVWSESNRKWSSNPPILFAIDFSDSPTAVSSEKPTLTARNWIGEKFHGQKSSKKQLRELERCSHWSPIPIRFMGFLYIYLYTFTWFLW